MTSDQMLRELLRLASQIQQHSSNPSSAPELAELALRLDSDLRTATREIPGAWAAPGSGIAHVRYASERLFRLAHELDTYDLSYCGEPDPKPPTTRPPGHATLLGLITSLGSYLSCVVEDGAFGVGDTAHGLIWGIQDALKDETPLRIPPASPASRNLDASCESQDAISPAKESTVSRPGHVLQPLLNHEEYDREVRRLARKLAVRQVADPEERLAVAMELVGETDWASDVWHAAAVLQWSSQETARFSALDPALSDPEAPSGTPWEVLVQNAVHLMAYDVLTARTLVVCAECGSLRVSSRVMYDPNTDQIDDTSSYDDPRDNWCAECEAEVKLALVGGEP